ncbi:MAG: hypothetical protein GXP54_07385 [Deltaproteobacteria bacterium]|nr:hypothetical protein [Deltaproteobacteria bacterium]
MDTGRSTILLAALLAAGLGCKTGPEQSPKTPSGGDKAQGAVTETQVEAKGVKAKGGAEKPIEILTPAVGKVLAGILKSADVKNKLPAGWSVASASVEGRKVSIHMKGPGQAAAVIDLLPKDTQGVPAGKWFNVKTPKQPVEMKAYAMAIDAAFGESPWTLLKPEKKPPAPAANDEVKPSVEGTPVPEKGQAGPQNPPPTAASAPGPAAPAPKGEGK